MIHTTEIIRCVRISYLWTFLIAATGTLAQTPYGNEWISPAQNYLRLGIIQDGWYCLKTSDSQQQGIDPATIYAQSLQLYRRATVGSTPTQIKAYQGRTSPRTLPC